LALEGLWNVMGGEGSHSELDSDGDFLENLTFFLLFELVGSEEDFLIFLAVVG
jgi:hypothetical protein